MYSLTFINDACSCPEITETNFSETHTHIYSSSKYAQWCKELNSYSYQIIVVDEVLKENALLASLLTDLHACEIIYIKAGEDSKTWQNLEALLKNFENLPRAIHCKDTCIISVGGGTVSDLVGLASHLIVRGVSYYCVPTTLLAMVDAAVGGKCGINSARGKNRIGAMHFPQKIWICETFLSSLAEKEIYSGIVELFKHSLLQGDAEFSQAYFWFSDAMKKKNSKGVLEALLDNPQIILSSAYFKQSIVELSEKIPHIRNILNLGHSVGHALEYFAWEKQYKEMSHGACVALGLWIEARIIEKHTGEKATWLKKWKKMILSEGLLSQEQLFIFCQLDLDEVLEKMKFDKKNNKDSIRISLRKDLSKPQELVVTEFGECLLSIEVRSVKESYLEVFTEVHKTLSGHSSCR